MTVEVLKRIINDRVTGYLFDSMLLYTRKYSDVMSKQDILTEFFLAMTKLCHDVDKYLEEEEKDCD